MANQLGHNSPLGAFHNLGNRVQRRSLGASPLSILDLKTFYPYGFPAIAPERSVSEAQPNSADDNTVARQIDTSAPDTQLPSTERPPTPLSSEQAAPFRTSLQRYFKPETSAASKGEITREDTSLSQPGIVEALTHQVIPPPNLAHTPTSDLQLASAVTTASNWAAANVETTLSQNAELISENHTLQRSTTEDIPKPASDSFQLSGTNTADIADSSQNQQPSSSTSQIPADNHSEIQRTTDLTSGQSASLPIDSPIVESNTPALAQQPPAASININHSIQSLRTPFASVQRSDEQHTQSVEQSSDFNTQSGTDSKPLIPSSISPSLDAHPALQPDISGPSVQRLHESTKAPSSLPSPTQNLAAPSALEPDPTLQRQPDSATTAIPARPATPQTEAIQRVTEQNNTASEPLSGSEDFSYQPSTHNSSDSVSTGPLTGSIQNSQQPEPVSDQLDISFKIQAKPNQTPFSSSSSTSSTAQQQSNLASENFGPNQPSISSDQSAPPFSDTERTLNEQAAIAPTPSTTAQTSSHIEIQRFPNLSAPDISSTETYRSPSAPTEQSSATEPTTVDALSIQPGDSAHQEIQRTTDTAQLAASTISTTNPKQIAPVTDVQSPSGVTSPIVQSMTAANGPSIANGSIQQTAEVTQPAKSVTSASLSEQVNPLADVQRASEAALPLAQSKLPAESLDQIQQPPNIASEDSVNAVTSPAATNIVGSVQKMAESSTLETPISETPASNLSETSGQNFDSNQQVTEAAAQSTGKAPQSVISVPLVSELSSAIQRTTGQSHIISDEDLGNTEGSLAANPNLELSQTNATNSISDGNGESSDIADSVQRSTGDQDAIALSSPTSQTSDNTKIQSSSNRSGLDTSSRKTNLLSSPPAYQPSSATESATLDPIDREPVSNLDESIQRETIDSVTSASLTSESAQTSSHADIQRPPSLSDPSIGLIENSLSADLEASSTASSAGSIQRDAIASPQDIAIQPRVTQPAKPSHTTLASIQRTDNIKDPAATSSNSLTHKTLGPSSRQQLPALKPLGVKPLPSLKTDKPVIPSSVSPQSQSSTIQRQGIPSAGANLESLVTGLANSQQDTSISPETTQKPVAEQTANSPLSANVDSKNDNSATTQHQPSQTNSSIQRDADSIPSEWSNLEDLVTHLQGDTSNHTAAKTTFSDQPASQPTAQPTAKAAPQPEPIPQSTKLSKPANVTVQRQITSLPSGTKPTIIQACQDTSANVASSGTNEQTDEQTDDSHSYSQYVELLAQEVYGLLRQRLSLEQERRGPKYPR